MATAWQRALGLSEVLSPVKTVSASMGRWRTHADECRAGARILRGYERKTRTDDNRDSDLENEWGAPCSESQIGAVKFGRRSNPGGGSWRSRVLNEIVLRG
jgi:hypothetical protein